MNYNPNYAVYVKHNVSQEIWQMHDIYIWHFLLESFGQKKTFKYLQYRLENSQNMRSVYIFLFLVFAITWLVTFFLRFNSLRRQFRHQNFKTILVQLFQQMSPNLNNLIGRRYIRARRILNRNNRNRLNNQNDTNQASNRISNTQANRSNRQHQGPNEESQRLRSDNRVSNRDRQRSSNENQMSNKDNRQQQQINRQNQRSSSRENHENHENGSNT